MKAHWTPIIFAAGLGAGWLIFGGDMRANAETGGNQAAAPVARKREARPEKTPHESKFRSFAKEFPKLSDEDKTVFQKSLAPGDRAAAIEAMLAQTGPEGISWKAKAMIGDVLFAWAHEDFDGAWAWCRQLESDANRKFVASNLLTQLAGDDLDRAFALHLEMAAEDPEFRSSVPLTILKKAATKDAASFLDLLGKLPIGDYSGIGTAVDFAANFDFQQAANGVAALMKNVEDSVPVFPTNFLSTWAMRDADAAYAWYSKHPRGSHFEVFVNLLDGIEKQGVAGAAYPWAADKLSQPGTERDAVIRAITEDSSERRSTVINSIAQAMSDAASRDRFLGDAATMGNSDDAALVFSYALTQMSSPAARLETLQHIGKKGNLDAAKIPDALLQQWGLTRQQVEQLQSPGR